MTFDKDGKHDPRKVGTFPRVSPSQYDSRYGPRFGFDPWYRIGDGDWLLLHNPSRADSEAVKDAVMQKLDEIMRDGDGDGGKEPDWASLARDTVTKSREDEYGHPMINFLRIALRWSNWLGVKVTPADVAWMMVDSKMARENHVHKDDNAIDIIGYTLCYQRMDRWMKDKGYSKGIRAFDAMNIQFMQRIYEQALGE